MRRTVVAPCSTLLVGVSALLAVCAMTEGPIAAQSFREVVDVRVINVDVHVVGRKGQPIEGLTREDFRLFEDGVEVEITNFYAGSSTAKGMVEQGQLPTGSSDTRFPLLERDRPPLWAVVYLDDLNLEPAHRSRVYDDLQRFAQERAGEDVQFLLASHELGLKIHTGFLDKPGRIVEAMRELGPGSGLGVQRRKDYQAVLKAIQVALSDLCDYSNAISITAPDDQPNRGSEDPCECAWPYMMGAWREYASSVETRVNAAAHGVGELISALGGLEGRKAFFYVSSGLQQRPGISVIDYMGELCPYKAQELGQVLYEYDTTPILESVAAHANANRVTFYPLDAAGARPEEIAGVELASALFRPSAGASQTRRANLQASLWVLAEQTGGRAIVNANQPFADLDETALDFDNFYSLGFSPAREPDGGTHELRVELRSKRKVDLRYRRVYRDKPLEERLGDRLMTTLRFGVDDNPLAVTAAAGRPVALEGKLFEVPVHIRLPADRLVTVGEEAASGRVRVFLAAEDERGRRTPLKEKLIELPAPAAGAAPAVHEMVVGMRLRAGPHRISIGVRDEVGVEMSLLRIAVEVDPADSVTADEAPGR